MFANFPENPCIWLRVDNNVLFKLEMCLLETDAPPLSQKFSDRWTNG